MHGGEVDEGYCIANSDALEESMTLDSGLLPYRHKMPEEYFKKVEHVMELDDGYSFQFPSKWDSVGKLVEFITEERKNNPSVEFELNFEENKGPLVLQIKGEAAKDYVRSFVPASIFKPS